MPSNDTSTAQEGRNHSDSELAILRKLDDIRLRITRAELNEEQVHDLADRLDSLDANRRDNGAHLESQVSDVIAELKLRQEEMKHVHDLCIMKVEMAAQKLLALESDNSLLKEELDADEQELLYLKIQLKALEVQAAPYIPPEDKEGLQKAFDNWKTDWASTSSRFRNRKSQRS